MATASQLSAMAERPAVPIQTESFRLKRPDIVGPEFPEPPFPIRLCGPVQKGFGRGGKELGCPTANLPDEALPALSEVAQTGIYYGFAQVLPPKDDFSLLCEEDTQVFPMVMSLGWNPFYKNERLSAEIHVMHRFKRDFYGFEMRVVILGYIRPELDYTSREGLIEDIEMDKRVAMNCLKRPEYHKFEKDPYFRLIRSDTNGRL